MASRGSAAAKKAKLEQEAAKLGLSLEKSQGLSLTAILDLDRKSMQLGKAKRACELTHKQLLYALADHIPQLHAREILNACGSLHEVMSPDFACASEKAATPSDFANIERAQDTV